MRSADAGVGDSDSELSEEVGDVVLVSSAPVVGEDGASDSAEDVCEVTFVIRGTVEKSPGELSIISTTAATTRTADATAITMPRSLALRVKGGRSGSFTRSLQHTFAGHALPKREASRTAGRRTPRRTSRAPRPG